MTQDEKLLEVQALSLEVETTVKAIREKVYCSVEQAAADRTLLRQLSHRWHAVRQFMTTPAIRPLLKESLSYSQGMKRIDAAITKVNDILQAAEEGERAKCQESIAASIAKEYPELSSLAPAIAASPIFADRVFYTSGIKAGVWNARFLEKTHRVARELAEIFAMPATDREFLVFQYLQTGNLHTVQEYRTKLEAVRVALPDSFSVQDETDRRKGSVVLSLNGQVTSIEQVMAGAQMLGIELRILENGMPGEPHRTDLPPRDFVSVDLETTGSWGVKNGDQPAQIIEIGAVKVVDGQIVERFDLLVNPGRHITEPARKITHITDEMVRGQPSVAEGIQRLVAFAGDLPWVGHDFLANDMPLILRAASPCGITIEPDCFDTFHYASAHKEEWGLTGLSLKALSEYYGIEHGQLHRAVEDAEVTAKLVLKIIENGI